MKLRGGLPWDVQETDITKSCIILLRKRTRNFIDASNLWKRSVLHGIDGIALNDVLDIHTQWNNTTVVPEPLVPDVNTFVVGRHNPNVQDDPDNDEDVLANARPHIRFPSPTAGTSSWSSASLCTWGHGNRQ